MQKSLVITFIALIGVAICAPSANFVGSVPGFPGDLPFDAYAGYLPANDGQKQMFYFFAESQSDPSNDPVVMWLNGGPGCSSFDGFVYEQGPFFFNSGPMGLEQNLTLNPYSWNKVANMIYLDSPCGVGLSYSTNQSDYITNDKVTAMDSNNFLRNFFTAYPEFQENDFYIAGESYAGIYVPTLAQQIMLGNKNGQTPIINLEGILVGNGVTDEVFDGNAWLPFVYGHSFISDGEMEQVLQACEGYNIWNATGNCANILGEVSNNTAALNIYNVYLDCYQGESEMKHDDQRYNLMHRVTSKVRETLGFDVPCIDSDRATAWLNEPAVRTAIHAIPVTEQEWTICSGQIEYTSIYTTVIPIHQQLLADGVRILIYSGDCDMCVPNTGSEAWTDSLNLPLVDDWRAWFVNNQVAGYVREYKGLTYATIKGAGHMVPQYRPPQAFFFFSNFLQSIPL